MIRELGNVELFELCETFSKVQCSHRLLHWSQGIVYCICGQFLVDSESRRKFNKLRLDALSIPNYVIKKGRNHARNGKTEEQKEYHMAWNAWKRCCKKVDSQGEHFTGIHDRFLRDPVCRESQLANGWTEQKCKEWDEFAQENHTYRLTPEEKKRYPGQWYLTLNKSGKNGPMKLRSDFRATVLMKNRLHHGNNLKSLSIQINADDGIPLQAHRGGTSLNGIGNELINVLIDETSFCYSWFRLQSIAIQRSETKKTVRRNIAPKASSFLKFYFLCPPNAPETASLQSWRTLRWMQHGYASFSGQLAGLLVWTLCVTP